MSVGSNQVEDTDVFLPPESDFVAVDHVTVKDDSIERYVGQLLGHAQYHTGTISNPFCCFGEKHLDMKIKTM